ncbi:MAG: amidohydrolase family protein [Chthoniobacterales bacterium]
MIIDCHNHIGVDPLFYKNKWYPYAQDAESLVRQGTTLGVDYWVAFPFVSYLGLKLDDKEVWSLNPGEPQTPYAFENERFLTEVHQIFPDEGKKIIPFVMLDPSRQTHEQVAALRQLKGRFPIAGLKIQATIIQSPIRDLLDAGACLLDLAEEWDLPLLIHSSIHPEDIWSQAGDILDVVEARPKIRFNVAHSCRFDRPSLDRLAELPNAWFDCSAHIIHTRLAVENSPVVATPARRVDADYRDPAAVLARLHELYPNKILWGSDSPFQSYIEISPDMEYRLFCTYKEEVDVLKAQSDSAIQDMAWTNPLAHLGASAPSA